MQKIKLPRHDWFMGAMEQGGKTNRYTGSLRVDTNAPALMSGSINFEVSVEKKEDETYSLKVVSWMIGRYPDFKRSFEETNEFEFTPDGIISAEKFLDEKYIQVTRRDLLGEE